jgi:hypothetical protein
MPVRFRGKDGRFVPAEERFTQAKTVEAFRRGRWVTLIEEKKGHISPKDLAIVLNRKEFENIAPAYDPVVTVKPRSKYQAWNIAEQIDKTRGVRRKLLRVKITIQDSKGKQKQVQFYQKINKNQKSSARIYHRINEVLGAEGYYTYKTGRGGGIIGERKGRKVKIVKATVEQVL